MADPAGSDWILLTNIFVEVIAGADVIESSAFFTTWVVVALAVLLCGYELFKTLHHLCHPETTERRAHENWIDKLELEQDRANRGYEVLEEEV